MSEEKKKERVLVANAWDIPPVVGELAKLQAYLLSSASLLGGDLEWGLILKAGKFFLRFQDSDVEDEAICEIDLKELEVNYSEIAHFEYASEEPLEEGSES